jgi:hypothetical protein
MRLLQFSNNSDHSTHHLRVHAIAEPKKFGRPGQAGTKNQGAVLEAAEAAQVVAAALL